MVLKKNQNVTCIKKENHWNIDWETAARQSAIITANLVIDICENPPGNIPARQGVLARLLPNYEAVDPITKLETRIENEPKVLETLTIKAKRTLKLLVGNVAIYSSAELADVAGTLVTGNLIIAHRGHFEGESVAAVENHQKITEEPNGKRLLNNWLTNDKSITNMTDALLKDLKTKKN